MGVGHHLVEIRYREGILRALVFDQILPFEYGGDVLINNNILLFLDYYDIDPKRLPGKLVFHIEVQDILVFYKFQPDGIVKRRMPSDTLIIKVYRGIVVVRWVITDDRFPPADTVGDIRRRFKSIIS
ncbi:hypothetical protein AGMMS50267_14180 [Spirochaetia bacterium]|nr:hypothetical protein AGMMS50267_14180 [Spirochaetia bacterium]